MSNDLADLHRLTSAGILEDPYPVFDRLLRAGVQVGRHGDVIASRHADVVTVLRNPAFGRDPIPWLPSRSMRVLFRMFLALDPPDHTRLRQVVSPLLSADGQARLSRHAELAAERLLDDADAASFDVVHDFARPLALDTICAELGVDHDQRDGLGWAASALPGGIDAPFVMRPTKPIPVLALVATRRMRPLRSFRAARVVVRLADKVISRSPRPDDTATLTAIRSAASNGSITAEEAASIWVQLLIAGVDTSSTLISNAAHLLCRHPDQLELLRRDQSLIDSAIEEVLRYESPVRLMGRVAHADVVVGGRTVRKGEAAIAIFAAANRDPDVFTDPHRFDVTRPTKPAHIAFGQGIHFCLGAALARLEARAALTALIPRIPTDAPASLDVRWRRLYTVRGLDTFRMPLTERADRRHRSPAQ